MGLDTNRVHYLKFSDKTHCGRTYNPIMTFDLKTTKEKEEVSCVSCIRHIKINDPAAFARMYDEIYYDC